MSIRNYSNTAAPQTLLTAITSDLTVSLNVGDTSTYPSAPFILAIDRGTSSQEVVECTAVPDSTHFTVTRGFDGSAKHNHSIGGTVEHASAAIDYREPNALINTFAAKGDLLVGQGAGTYIDLAVGTDGQALVANSAATAGLAYAQVIPVGVVLPTAASGSAPTGFLLCNGSAVSRSTYAALFAAIGTAYGVGDGSTTFNVPNMAVSFPLGAGVGHTLGTTGGEQTHTLTTPEIPSHSHLIGFSGSLLPAGGSGSGGSAVVSDSQYTGNTGGGGAHNNMPPYVVFNFIIKT